ncbi:MAG: SusD/RagB family nutrient-binding outer membrane lipoprotein [Paramuribaculum sp.]|nr:SusD/RagB family nutrient-binding outer membrane lipoprotein [Paramuribaculum sp.]
MKKSIIFTALSLMAAAPVFQSCGDELKPYPWIVDNGDDNNSGNVVLSMDIIERELRGAIPFMLNYSHEPTGTWAPHKYQYYRANTIDNYAGYWTTSKANFAFGPALPTLYTDNNGYLGGPKDNQIYQQAFNALTYAAKFVDEDGKPDPRPEWRAIALIAEAYQTHEIVDFYGVCPFNDWKNVKRTIPLNYESGPEVYKQLFADLDEAVRILKERQPSPEDLRRVEGTDQNKTCTNWEWTYWVKFANSIKLRMAMNMVDYKEGGTYGSGDYEKPFDAQKIAEEAVADGVLTDNDPRDVAYHSNQTWVSCLYFMTNTWNDLRLCASLENILKHFNCPLMNVWFDENSYAIKNSAGVTAPNGVYGVRIGLMMQDTGNADTGGYGPFATLSARCQYMKQPFFKRTEALMLMAEGALRGWSMGGATAQELYERAIRLSFREWSEDIPNPIYTVAEAEALADEYLAQDELPTVEYRDYYKRDNDIAGRVSIGVKWNENDSKELKLEKIITQKYIVNFPMSAEAWTTYRRTGYPRLFPPRYNNMADVDTELGIRRLTFERTSNNGAEIDQITELLGGSQTAGVRVFWDINSLSWCKDENGQVIPNNNLN